MKKIIVALALMLGLGTVAVAQETTQQPKTEKSCCKKDKKSCKKMEKKCTCKTDGKCTCKTESNPTCACKADMKASEPMRDAKGRVITDPAVINAFKAVQRFNATMKGTGSYGSFREKQGVPTKIRW